MSRLTGLALAAALLAVTGCAKDSPNLTATSTSASVKKEETFDGAPRAVAAAAQVALQQMDVVAMLSETGNTVRLTGSTRQGKAFVLTFERRKVAGVEKTAVRIIWAKGVDDPFWMDFMGTTMTVLESQQRKALRAGK